MKIYQLKEGGNYIVEVDKTELGVLGALFCVPDMGSKGSLPSDLKQKTLNSAVELITHQLFKEMHDLMHEFDVDPNPKP